MKVLITCEGTKLATVFVEDVTPEGATIAFKKVMAELYPPPPTEIHVSLPDTKTKKEEKK